MLELLAELSRQGYVVTAVGGIVRDYFLDGRVGTDWDLEIRHPTLAWDLKAWKELGKSLGKCGRVTFLPYDVMKIDGNDLSFELSPPRKESFSEESHHKNFTVTFDYRLSFEEAVRRRDFTVNAMGIRFDQKGRGELLDPLNGLLHLRDRELYSCSEDFGRDPVRFVRALRFAAKLGFTISSELRAKLDRMNLGSVSHSYLWSEMQKSRDPVGLLERLLNEKETHPELSLPTGDIRAKIPALRSVLSDASAHEAWIIALEWEGIDSASWQKYFGLSSETSRRLGRWARATREFVGILPEEFHGEFDALKDAEKFEKLFDWYFTTRQILQKNPRLPLLSMIDTYLPNWVHLYKFEAPKDVKHIDPPYRAKYQVWNLCQRL